MSIFDSGLSFPEKFRGRKPSKSQMEEIFWEIVKFIKKSGCPVTIHKNLSKINGSNGYFCSDPRPHIKVAIKGKGFATQYTWDRIADQWHMLFLQMEVPFIRPMELETIT